MNKHLRFWYHSFLAWAKVKWNWKIEPVVKFRVDQFQFCSNTLNLRLALHLAGSFHTFSRVRAKKKSYSNFLTYSNIIFGSLNFSDPRRATCMFFLWAGPACRLYFVWILNSSNFDYMYRYNIIVFFFICHEIDH